jgi:hypothetical protein
VSASTDPPEGLPPGDGMPPGDETPRTPPEIDPTPGSRTVEGRDSIIERFRGTEWDTRTQPVDPMLVRRSSNRASQAIIVVGLAVLLAAVGGGAVVLLQPGSTPFPSPFLRPAPTQADAPVLAAFWQLVEPSTLSYHLVSAGSETFAGKTLSFSLSLDIDGDNFTGRITESPPAHRASFVRYAGFLYIKFAGQTKWATLETQDRDRRESPFMGLDDHRELISEGPFIEGGKRLYRLVSTAFYRPSIARMLDLNAFGFPFGSVAPSLELIVTEAGVPVRATFTVTVAADAANGVLPFKGSSTFMFSKFGQVVKIAAPA